MTSILNLEEPKLRFGHGQALVHPKDGLTLFGPYATTSGSVRFGVIGTRSGLELFDRWVIRINKFIPAYKGSIFRRKNDSEFGKLAHQPYPGFEATFGLTWNLPAEVKCEIVDEVLKNALQVHELHTRISKVVKAYTKRLIQKNYESEDKPDIWFIVVPKEINRLCRPLSESPRDYLEGTRAEDAYQYKLFVSQEDTDNFSSEYKDALNYKPDFHNQLKAQLLDHQIITQVLQEETLKACMRKPDDPAHNKQDPATIAWNLTTAIYYKTRRRPWILADARQGVCYIGIVFKRLFATQDRKNACCGAQMFLEDGDGMVFKGALGPWYSEELRECHLDQGEAGRLLRRAIQFYADEHGGSPPREVFIHGSVRFNESEWLGFIEAAAGFGTNVTGVRVRKVENGIKLYTRGKGAVMRNTVLKISDTKAFLWTSGFVPRLNTYPGWNVPNPLDIEICNGQGDLQTILKDILRLSKLNYNSCVFADSFPVTLKFASKVGNILTTAPLSANKVQGGERFTPLPFWHYI